MKDRERAIDALIEIANNILPGLEPDAHRAEIGELIDCYEELPNEREAEEFVGHLTDNEGNVYPTHLVKGEEGREDLLNQLEASIRWQLDEGRHNLFPPPQYDAKAWHAGYESGLRDALDAIDHIQEQMGAAFTQRPY